MREVTKMENKKKALGMGLEQLFNGDNIDIASFEKKIYENRSLKISKLVVCQAEFIKKFIKILTRIKF